MTQEERDRKLDTLLALQLSTRQALFAEMALQRAMLERLLGRPALSALAQMQLDEEVELRSRSIRVSIGFHAEELQRIAYTDLWGNL